MICNHFDKFRTGISSGQQQQSDRNIFISRKTCEQVIDRRWGEVSMSSGKESINLRNASTDFAVVPETLSAVRLKVGSQLIKVHS